MKQQAVKFVWAIIPLLFLLYIAPGTLDYVFTHADEKHYTDAALQMIDKQDYFTPHKADGSPRFLKPIVTYWAVAGSYKIWGISPFSSRFMFWLAGGLLVMVAFFMTESLTKNKTVAATAAFITAANPLVIISAGRSIPDILLVLFLTISAWGFMEIMVAKKTAKKYFWLAYGGAALAFETKGLPAAAFAGTSILFLLFNPWKKKKLSEIIEPASLITAVAVALGWFVIMYIQHGADYLSSFYTDQVGGRVSFKFVQVFKNAGLGLLTIIVVFIPWVFIVFSIPNKIKSQFRALPVELKAIFGFIVAWLLLVILMSGAVFKFYDRYILPVVPLSAILIALILNYQNKKKTIKTATIIFYCLNGLIIFINIIFLIFAFQPVLLFSTIATGAIIAILSTGALKQNHEIILANSILFLFFNLFILLNSVLLPNHGKLIVGQIETQVELPDNVYVYGSYSLAANLRVHSKNSFPIIGKNKDYSLPDNSAHLLVLRSNDLDKIDLKNYRTTLAGGEFSGLKTEKLPAILQPFIITLKENSRKYYIAISKNSEQP